MVLSSTSLRHRNRRNNFVPGPNRPGILPRRLAGSRGTRFLRLPIRSATFGFQGKPLLCRPRTTTTTTTESPKGVGAMVVCTRRDTTRRPHPVPTGSSQRHLDRPQRWPPNSSELLPRDRGSWTAAWRWLRPVFLVQHVVVQMELPPFKDFPFIDTPTSDVIHTGGSCFSPFFLCSTGTATLLYRMLVDVGRGGACDGRCQRKTV